MKSIITVPTCIVGSILFLYRADALTLYEFLVGSTPRSLFNAFRELLIPPSNINDSIQYQLFTPSHPKEACHVEPTPEEFDSCDFDPSRETKILIHGFIVELKPGNQIEMIKDALLEYGSYNVIIVDWTRYNVRPYLLAFANTIPVGKKIGEFITFVKKHTGAKYASFHLIGWSLGSHISGIAGQTINPPGRLGRITGLDPAGLLYENNNTEYQLGSTDARFVDIVHTSNEFSGQGVGKFVPIGHMDFYPDGGEMHPACKVGKKANIFGDIVTIDVSPAGLFNLILCNHVMSLEYFLHSIFDCDYVSTKCQNYSSLPACSRQGNTTSRMGLHAKRIPGLPNRSKFYLKTSANAPFC